MSDEHEEPIEEGDVPPKETLPIISFRLGSLAIEMVRHVPSNTMWASVECGTADDAPYPGLMSIDQLASLSRVVNTALQEAVNGQSVIYTLPSVRAKTPAEGAGTPAESDEVSK